MTSAATIFLALTLLLFTTLTLIPACQFMGAFLCLPNQYSCQSRGGKCSVQGGNCVCVSRSAFFGNYDPRGYGPLNGYQGRRAYVDPEQARKNHPLSERNIEEQTKLLTSMTRLYNVIN